MRSEYALMKDRISETVVSISSSIQDLNDITNAELEKANSVAADVKQLEHEMIANHDLWETKRTQNETKIINEVEELNKSLLIAIETTRREVNRTSCIVM